MKGLILSLAIICGHFIYAQNKPMTVRFLPITSVGKSKGVNTEVKVNNTGASKGRTRASKKILTKNVMRFGEYNVSDVSFKSEEHEFSVSHFLKYVNSKVQSSSLFTVGNAIQKALVQTAENVKVESIGGSSWTNSLISFKGRLVSTGIININSSKWEYFVEDKTLLNNLKGKKP